jgi:hypothetical protein
MQNFLNLQNQLNNIDLDSSLDDSSSDDVQYENMVQGQHWQHLQSLHTERHANLINQYYRCGGQNFGAFLDFMKHAKSYTEFQEFIQDVSSRIDQYREVGLLIESNWRENPGAIPFVDDTVDDQARKIAQMKLYSMGKRYMVYSKEQEAFIGVRPEEFIAQASRFREYLTLVEETFNALSYTSILVSSGDSEAVNYNRLSQWKDQAERFWIQMDIPSLDKDAWIAKISRADLVTPKYAGLAFNSEFPSKKDLYLIALSKLAAELNIVLSIEMNKDLPMDIIGHEDPYFPTSGVLLHYRDIVKTITSNPIIYSCFLDKGYVPPDHTKCEEFFMSMDAEQLEFMHQYVQEILAIIRDNPTTIPLHSYEKNVTVDALSKELGGSKFSNETGFAYLRNSPAYMCCYILNCNVFPSFYKSSLATLYDLILIDVSSGYCLMIPKYFAEVCGLDYSAITAGVHIKPWMYPVLMDVLQAASMISLKARIDSDSYEEFIPNISRITGMTHSWSSGTKQKRRAFSKCLAAVVPLIGTYSGLYVLVAMRSKKGKKALQQFALQNQFFSGLDEDDFDDDSSVNIIMKPVRAVRPKQDFWTYLNVHQQKDYSSDTKYNDTRDNQADGGDNSSAVDDIPSFTETVKSSSHSSDPPEDSESESQDNTNVVDVM